MEVGDRVLVLHRPARIAFEARMDRSAGEDARKKIHEKILEVLALERAGERVIAVDTDVPRIRSALPHPELGLPEFGISE